MYSDVVVAVAVAVVVVAAVVAAACLFKLIFSLQVIFFTVSSKC